MPKSSLSYPKVSVRNDGLYYIEFRLLNKNGIFNIETNINDNDDGKGTKHYIFADATLESKIDKFDVFHSNVVFYLYNSLIWEFFNQIKISY